MFDMRAYIASLIGVFLALAIGILLGLVLQEKTPLVSQIDRQIRGLEADVKEVRTENSEMSSEAASHRDFERRAVPVLAEGRLAGTSVVLVSGEKTSTKLSTRVAKVLEDAGGDVAQIKMGRTDLSERRLRSLEEAISEGGDATADASSSTEKSKTADAAALSVESLPGLLADALVEEDGNPLLVQMSRAGLMRLVTPVPVEVRAALILVDPTEERDRETAEGFLVSLSEELAERKLQVVAAEAAASDDSLMSLFGAPTISTVDNIDEPLGELSAVYALSGVSGSYGSKEQAESPVPELR